MSFKKILMESDYKKSFKDFDNYLRTKIQKKILKQQKNCYWKK